MFLSLAGGLFTGKYNINKTHGPENPTWVDNIYRVRYLRDSTLEALAVIEPVVRDHGLTLLETAVRWMMHHSALKMRTDGENE
jgi:aflatoxin B1 aldehyde reductase